nr:YdcH family protein [Novosphingobium sp. UBA1939]
MESSHILALQEKHHGLERRIQQEMKSPHPDLAMIASMKKHKLRIRDEIARH